MLTACGIETLYVNGCDRELTPVATVLTACGIETWKNAMEATKIELVATVLTACGIETIYIFLILNRCECCSCNSAYRLRY